MTGKRGLVDFNDEKIHDLHSSKYFPYYGIMMNVLDEAGST
jgi:hypothetical protein